MTETDKQQFIQLWFEENEPFGKQLGYPDCCIAEFCQQPPEILRISKVTEIDKLRYQAGCINGQFTGFIPCADHAIEILKGNITLHSLIYDRNPMFPPFPNV